MHSYLQSRYYAGAASTTVSTTSTMTLIKITANTTSATGTNISWSLDVLKRLLGGFIGRLAGKRHKSPAG